METHQRKEWAAGLRFGPTAASLPEFYAEVFDRWTARTKDMHSNDTVNYGQYPVVAAMAELYNELRGRIAALEAQLSPAEKPVISESVAELETVPEVRPRETGTKKKPALIGA